MKTNKTFNNTMTWTNVQSRNSAFPLERYSIFAQLSDAADYALNNVLAYEGQVIAVTNNEKQEVYVLDSTLSADPQLSGLRKICDNDILSSLSANGYATETWVNEHKSKVTINNNSSPADLSVYKVTSDEYADIIHERDVLSNELYIIDDDEFVSVYGRQIKDVENGTSPADAVNMQQLNAYKTQLVDMLSSAFLSAGITKETPIDSISYGHAISCIYFLAQSIMR